MVHHSGTTAEGGASAGAGAGAGAGTTDAPASVAHVLSLLDTHADRAASYDTQLQEVEDEVEENKKMQQVLHQRLTSIGQAKAKAVKKSRDVTVIFVAAKSGQVLLRFKYLVMKASWKPAYDIRVPREGSTLSLTYYAQVQQNTGEDWTNANLVRHVLPQ